MAGLVSGYYELISQSVAAAPNQVVVVSCCMCGIDVLTSKSNEKRDDVRCVFGCRERHSKGGSQSRSAEYYSSPEGKRKKKAQNQKRSKKPREPEPSAPTKDLSLRGQLFKYYAWLCLIFDGRCISRAELLSLVEKIREEVSQQGLEISFQVSDNPDG